jgi:hypothetical protein
LPQDVLDLTIDAPHLILRPFFELCPERGVDTQQEGLTFHDYSSNDGCSAQEKRLSEAG